MQLKPGFAAARGKDVWLAMAVALCLSFVLGQDVLGNVWRTGVFIDPDDAARMVQIRDWMGGQGWYDLHLHRLGFPGADQMHWSRVVDAPVATLVRLFGFFLEAPFAERAARIGFPLLLMLALLGTAAAVARELVGEAGVLPALVLLALSGLPAGQFQPGRIDHHAPQILLLVLALLCLLRALDPVRGFRHGFLCAACLSLSLAISVENLPETLVMGAAFPLLWALEGKIRKAALKGFGLGVILVLPVVLGATLPPASWLRTSCDAASIPHFTLAMTGAGLCLAMVQCEAHLTQARARWGALIACGLLLPSLLLTLFPACAGDPYTGLDPVVRALWLNHVLEARSLFEAMHEQPNPTLIYLVPALIGLAGMAIVAWKMRDERRLKWLLLICVTLCALATTIWKVATISAFAALGCFGAMGLIALLPEALQSCRLVPAVVFSGLGALFVLPAQTINLSAHAAEGCLAPESFIDFAALPQGLVVAPIDSGAHVLAFTRNSVLAAPYHRNNAGNRLSLDVFRLPADEAMEHLRGSGADYLAICGSAKTSPLGAALTEGRVFDGLTKLDAGGPYSLWRINIAKASR